ncbi:YwqG family protein [Solibacillus daqui]|uniref:YwqG family protein n=1 Tax=Solibacillus daqui TaxID=2912187 RepID=UPI002365D674|nr:YwqG family protein [Solibacillus daqui]
MMNNYEKNIYIPKELTNFHTCLTQSAEQVAILTPVSQPAFLHESKFAGLPFLTHELEHPKDEYNQYMLLLAQINFAEFKLEKPFPEGGILQFYISQHCYDKVKFHSQYCHFKVQFLSHQEDYKNGLHDFTYLRDVNLTHFPIQQEMKLHATTQFEPVSATDYRLIDYFNPEIMTASITLDERSFEDVYLESYLAADHKIGGYPYFIHEDFRKQSYYLQHYDTLLLQIVSNDEQYIMWGDSGIISFFINSDKLANQDFSDIYFHIEEYD